MHPGCFASSLLARRRKLRSLCLRRELSHFSSEQSHVNRGSMQNIVLSTFLRFLAVCLLPLACAVARPTNRRGVERSPTLAISTSGAHALDRKRETAIPGRPEVL